MQNLRNPLPDLHETLQKGPDFSEDHVQRDDAHFLQHFCNVPSFKSINHARNRNEHICEHGLGSIIRSFYKTGFSIQQIFAKQKHLLSNLVRLNGITQPLHNQR